MKYKNQYFKYLISFVAGAVAMGSVNVANWEWDFDKFEIHKKSIDFISEKFKSELIEDKIEYDFLPEEIDSLGNGEFSTKIYVTHGLAVDTFVVFLQRINGEVVPFKAIKKNKTQ